MKIRPKYTMKTQSLPTAIRVVAFDADDTLWVNEPYYQDMERRCCELFCDIVPPEEFSKRLFAVEMENLCRYGFGAKGFMLCMLETALQIQGESISATTLSEIFRLGKELLEKPVELLDGVRHVLETLSGRYRLVVATKGDLLDQERKLKSSGLEPFFHHIEIMSDKTPDGYGKLLKHLDCPPEHFLMIGNSVKSDVLPVLEIGAHAVHVPFHTTWAHETVHEPAEQDRYIEVESLADVLPLLIEPPSRS